MAEGALLQLAGRVLELMDSLAQEKILRPAKTEIEGLKGAVSKIQAVILDAEKQSSRSDGIKYWLSELKDVLYGADDLLDNISTEVLRNKMKDKVRHFLSSIPISAASLKIVHQLKQIRESMDALSIERIKSQLDENFIDRQFMNRLTHSFVREDDVIGRKNDKKEILERLFNSDVADDISVIPIVGLGGLGKTTLAQLVYNDEIVKRHFELRIWICASDIFDLKRIVKDILEQLTKRKHEESLEILQNQLKKELNGKRYLIVFDDLWNENRNEWHRLRDMLMGGGWGSKIIVTTRSELVAKITGTTSPYALKGLFKETAWSLFVKMAFEQGKLREHETFISMREKIVEQCCGVPLAIKTIANLLYKASENELRSFINCELSKIALEKNDILLSLKLSYDHLPPNLKQCFAYCRLFPKDCKIHIETLINLWAAQGFIKISNSEQRVEDVGREYFMELLSRSFFQDVEADKLGNIVCCKMYNLMHDLASLMAGTESSMLASSGENIGEKVRHLSFDPEDLSCHPKDSLKQLPILMIKGKRIRTVLAASVGINLGKLTCDALISNLNYLRTLDLSNLRLPAVPLSIGRLKHLRYLDLSKNRYIEILPNSITKLLNLQTLLLNDCDKLKELPQDIEKLVNLRHLDITCCFKLTHMPLRLGYLTSLEILPMFVVRQEGVKVSSSGKYKKKQARSSGGLSELKELSNLGGSLLIQYLGHGKDDILECEASYMYKKQHLQGLELRWDEILERDGEIECYDEESLEVLLPHRNLKTLGLSYYMGMKIPSWVSSLTNLVNLELSKNRRLQHLPPLNHLPFLKFVTLIEIEALECISKDRFSEVFGSSSSKTTFFPSLSSLRIEKCPNLKGWWMNSDDDVNEPDHLLLPSFPRLFELRIVECPNLTSMPLFPHLKEILELCDSSLKVLRQTMKMEAITSTSSPSHNFPLSQLEVLSLDMIFDLDSLPEEWLRNLDSLQTLYITRCLGLKSLPWIGNLTSLQRLFIHECPNLTSLPIRDLKSLQHLAITGCPVLQQRYHRHTGEDWLNIAHVPHLDIERNQQEIISSESDSVCLIQKDLSTQNLPYFAGQVPSSPVIKKSKEISETEESGECEEETDADIETTLKAETITPEQDESNEEDPSPSLFSEDKSSLPLTQGAGESSSPMSQTPNSRNEADVLTNTWSNQDGVQDLSFESIKVSEISELMDLPTRVHSLKIEGCDDLEFIPQGQVPSSPVIKESNEISETEESGECEEETDSDIETTLKAKGIKPEQDESNEEDPSPSLFLEDIYSFHLTQDAKESSLSTSQDPVECSLPMSHTPNSRIEADVLTNTWSNQDGVQDPSFESIKVSEISELMDLPTRVHSLKIEGCDDLEFIPQGQVPSSPVIKESKEISETEGSGECEEETDADIETTLKEEGITPEKDESNEEDPSRSLFLEDKSSLPPTQGARESSLSTSQDPVECSLPMSHTPNSRNEADVLTNTWSNQDGVQDLSFESIKVSEISELMDLPSHVHSLKIEECDDLEFIPQGQVPSSPVIKESKEISETEESGECEEETDADIETTLKAEGIKPEQDESNEEDPSPSLFLEVKSSLPLTQVAGESSLSTSQDPVECSLPMSHTPNSRNEADVLTNTWSNQDGVQDLSFESIKVSEISELMDLPSCVHSLKIEECDDLEFIPKGVMSSELSLQDLYIINCCSLKSFPEDYPPTALEILYIRNCKKLNFPLTTEKKTHQDALLKYLCIGSSCDSLKFLSLDLFPNLKSLSIWDCANLESLSMPVQKNLTSLEALEIRDCPNLVSFIGGGLCTPNLMSIWLSNCKTLKKLPEMHTLGSLQSVFINNCPELVSLSEKGLPSRLSLLSITFCNKLKLKDEWGLDGLEYLRRLEIEGGCVDMESFPEKFLSSNLSSLRISGLSNLKNLDKGFQKLTTLQRLEISCCPNLRSLPEDGFPSSLSFLCIKKCSLLTSKLRNKKGKDWSKIDHISCIEIDEEVIS